MSAASSQAKSGEVTVIQPAVRVSFGLRDVMRRRELLRLLIGRQISARYRQMLLGALWAVFEPLGQLLLLTLIFGSLLKIDTEGFPYPVFVFSGLTAWLLFSRATMAAAGGLQDNMGLISKVYFPRLILPLAAVSRDLFDAMLTMALLMCLAMVYGFMPTLKWIALPFLLLYSAVLALAGGLWLATLIVKFRDVRPMLSLVLQAGMYATPIIYSPTVVPERIRPFYELNPMYWTVELSRWALIGKDVAITTSFYWSFGLTGLLLIGGLLVFSAYERMSVDVQ